MSVELPVTVIVGGSHGVGLAVARRLAVARTRLAIVDTESADLDALPDQLIRLGTPAVEAVGADVRDAAALAEAFATVRDRWPVINALVTALSLDQTGSVPDLDDERAWRSSFETGVVAVVRCVRLGLPLLTSPKWSRIVVISPTRDSWSRRMAFDSAVISALSIFTKALARDVRREGMLVNLVSPGSLLVDDDGVTLASGRDPDEVFDAYTTVNDRLGSMLTRVAPPELAHIADVVVRLASRENRFMTGEHITVDPEA